MVSNRWATLSATTTRRVVFSPTTCPAEIKIETTTNENRGLLYSSILALHPFLAPLHTCLATTYSGAHLFLAPICSGRMELGHNTSLIWNFGGAIRLESHQNFGKIRLYLTICLWIWFQRLQSFTSIRVVLMHLKAPQPINDRKRTPCALWPSDSCSGFVVRWAPANLSEFSPSC